MTLEQLSKQLNRGFRALDKSFKGSMLNQRKNAGLKSIVLHATLITPR